MEESNKPTVYLAGRISGLTFADATGWRNYVTDLLEDEFEVLNPMAKPDLAIIEELTSPTEPVADSYHGELSAANIFRADMEDVLNANFVIADLAHGVVFGTPFEVGVAWYNGSTIVFVDPENKFGKHPFVAGLAQADDAKETYLVKTYDEAVEVLKQLII